ncbi:MAG TPA: hypothetical protein VKE40_28530 [Gemmataceae bacterium]|nr:hypothetical protein [Gemmataceae bacterium]
MHRVSSILMSLGLCAVVWAAPLTKEKAEATAYIPAKPGARWEFQTPRASIVEVIKSVDKKDGATIISIGTDDGEGKIVVTERLEITGKGIFRIESRGDKLDPPLCLLKLPHSDGQTWESADASGDCKGKHKAFGPEEVVVPAGKYKAIRVESEYTFSFLSGKPTLSVHWYAPGVGLIKSTSQGKISFELRSFAVGGD